MDRSFISQGNSKADQAAKETLQSQEPDQIMALVTCHHPPRPELLAFLGIPHGGKRRLSMGLSGSIGRDIKDDKVLISGVQQWELVKGFHVATHS